MKVEDVFRYPDLNMYAAKFASFWKNPPSTLKQPTSRAELEDALALHLQWLVSVEDPTRTIEGERAALVSCDLRNYDLSNRDLRGIDLAGCQLDAANFSGSNLSFARFRSCTVDAAIFTDARVEGFSSEQVDWTVAIGLSGRLPHPTS
mgnify:CR=1 FL=1